MDADYNVQVEKKKEDFESKCIGIVFLYILKNRIWKEFDDSWGSSNLVELLVLPSSRSSGENQV